MPSAAIEFGENVHHAPRRARIERGDRLIGDQDLGTLDEGTGDGGTLLLAARQLRAAFQGLLGDADAGERVHGARAFSASVKRPIVPRQRGTWPRKPTRTLVSTDRRGTRLNCWKTTPMRERSALACGVTRPCLLHRRAEDADLATARRSGLRRSG